MTLFRVSLLCLPSGKIELPSHTHGLLLSVKGSICWWSQTSSRTESQAADINSSNYKHFFLNWTGTFMHSLAYIRMAVVCAAVHKRIVRVTLHCSSSLILYNTLKFELCNYSNCRNHTLSCTQLYMKLVQYGTTQSAIACLNAVAYFLHWRDAVAWEIMRQSSS